MAAVESGIVKTAHSGQARAASTRATAAHWSTIFTLPLQAAENLREAVLLHLAELQSLSEQDLIEQRYAKFRRMGRFLESGAQDAA